MRRDGSRLSFTDLGELRQLVRDPQRDENARRGALLAEILHMIEGGLPAVSVCTVEGLADELFTYGGSGTFFAAERYIAVRRLGIDDFDAACDLIARGVAEGYLASRSAEEVEELLASSFGAFVEGRHLAGIAALVPYEARVAEIASVYTLTRFLGEGVGGHLIAFAVERARELGCSFVFACTTSDRVLRFFERNGFRRARPDELPDAKWTGYDGARRATLHCLRRDLA